MSEDIAKIIEKSISDESAIFGGDKAALLAKTDAWFSQYGIISNYALNNLVIFFIGGNVGIRDVEFEVHVEKKLVVAKFFLNWWSFHFRKSKILKLIEKTLFKVFSEYDVEVDLYKYRLKYAKEKERKNKK